MLLPACLLLLVGGFYWVRVRLTAEGLLPAALRDYLREQAELDVQIERVRLGWRRVQVWNLAISLPDGTPIGQARYLELRPTSPLSPVRSGLRVQLERPRVQLLRDAQGRWNVEALLRGAPRRPTAQIPIELVSTGGVVELRDAFVRPRVATDFRLQQIQLRQPGGSVAVRAAGEASGVGRWQLHALSDGERWRLDISTDRLLWSFLRPYLAGTSIQMQSGEARVQASLVYAPRQPLRVMGMAQGHLQGVRYEQHALPWRELQFSAQFTESALDARLHSHDRRLTASGTLERLTQAWRYRLMLTAQGDDARLLERYLPPERREQLAQSLRMAGRYALQIQAAGRWQPRKVIRQGVPAWRDLLVHTNAVALVELASLQTPEGTLQAVRAPLLLSGGQLRLADGTADFAGGWLHANALVDFTARPARFTLTATARNVQLQQIPALNRQKLGGVAALQLLGEGTLQKPRLVANIFSDMLRQNGVRLGGLRARLHYAGNRIEIPVALLQGAIGSVQVAGQLEWRGSRLPVPDQTRLNLRLAADELDLNRLASLFGYQEGVLGYWESSDGSQPRRVLRLDGIAYLRGTLNGTLSQPVLQAQATVFDGRLGDIGMELVASRLTFRERRIRLPEIVIYRRTAVAQASGEIELPAAGERGAVRFHAQGRITDFDLATLTEWSETPIRIGGLANLSFALDGTPERFTLTGDLDAERTQIDQIATNHAAAQFRIARDADQTTVRLDTAQVQLQGGVVSGQMQLIADSESTRVDADWNARAVPLTVLAPYLPPDYRLQGVLNASGQVRGTLDAPHADARWQLSDLMLNRVALGSATGTARWTPSPEGGRTDGMLSLQARLDAPDGSVQIESLRYQTGDKALAAQGTLEAIPLPYLYRLALALPVELPPELVERADTLDGRLSVRWQLAGSTEQPQLAFDGRAVQLAWNGQALGELQAQGEWSQQQLSLQVSWQAESARLKAQGTLREDALNAEMELTRFPLEWARLWEPSLPAIRGNLDISAQAAGDPDQPNLTLSATVQNLTIPLPAPSAEPSGEPEQPAPPQLTIDQLLFSRIDVREGVIETDDALIQIRGYRARLSGRLPFHWSPIRIPRDEPLAVQLVLNEQPLRILELALPVDAERTQGVLNARLEIGGTLDTLQPRGELSVTGGSLALESYSSYLQELGLQVEFDGQRARIVQAQARSSAGGTVQLEGEVDVAREEPALALTGTLNGFTINEPRLPIGGSAFGRIDGSATLQGTLQQPQLVARLQVRDGFLSLPAELQVAPGGFAPPLNPDLDVQVAIARGFTLRNPNLDARMEGSLQIAGTVREPRASGTFSLLGGSLKLPTARLRLEPEGVIMLTYPYTAPTGEVIARLNLDVRATTTVVALDYTGDPQRYRVELDIRGPLDDPERFQMVARSDPPGLSEQRILSLLGRGAALESLARGGDPVQIFRQQLSEMLTGQVLPGLFYPFETEVAEALGLEQFALDYTGVAPATLYLVKELFNGFGISYRRSLSLANPQYEVRLFYRLPFRNRFLQRLKLGWGFDNAQRNFFFFIEGSLLFR